MPSVTRRSQKGRAARREEIRDRLLGVVERLIDEGESYTEISVERLVAAAEMSRSTFYVYFEDKGDLLRAWFEGVRSELSEASAGWWAIDGDSTREDLRAALATIVAVYHPHMKLMAALYDAAAYDSAVRELTTDMMGLNVATLRKHIRTGQKDGFIDPSLPPAEVASWLTWMQERTFHMIVRSASGAELERQIDAYAAIIWNVLYAPTRT